MLTRAEGGRVRLFTRNGNDWTRKLPQLAKALEDHGATRRLVRRRNHHAGRSGVRGFPGPAGRLRHVPYRGHRLLPLRPALPARLRPARSPAGGTPRRAAAHRPSTSAHDKVRFSAAFDGKPQDILASACRLGLEGVVGKRKDSAYVLGAHPAGSSSNVGQRQEFVIGGYTDPTGSRTGLGSLLLGVHDRRAPAVCRQRGHGLRRADRCANCAPSWAISTPMPAPSPPTPSLPRNAHWVKPKLIGEVAFGDWTRGGRIRHSVFHGLRADKPPKAITREEPRHMTTVDKPAAAAKATLPASLRVSNPDRLIDAESGTTQDRTGALLRAGRAADDGAPEGQARCLAAGAAGPGRRTVLPEARRALQDAGRRAARPGHRPGSPALARGRVAGRPVVGGSDERRRVPHLERRENRYRQARSHDLRPGPWRRRRLAAGAGGGAAGARLPHRAGLAEPSSRPVAAKACM